MLQVCTKYDVRWSEGIRTWKSSFKAGLFRYGASETAFYLDDEHETHIEAQELRKVLDRVHEEKGVYQITDSLTSDVFANILERILEHPTDGLVRLRWS